MIRHKSTWKDQLLNHGTGFSVPNACEEEGDDGE